MARKKKHKFDQELIGEVKQALDDMLRHTPEGHIIVLDKLPEPFKTVLVHMSALGAMFGTKVVLHLKDDDGRYKDEYVVFTAAKYQPVRRNSRRRSVRRNSRRVAARKRRRTSRN